MVPINLSQKLRDAGLPLSQYRVGDDLYHRIEQSLRPDQVLESIIIQTMGLVFKQEEHAYKPIFKVDQDYPPKQNYVDEVTLCLRTVVNRGNYLDETKGVGKELIDAMLEAGIPEKEKEKESIRFLFGKLGSDSRLHDTPNDRIINRMVETYKKVKRSFRFGGLENRTNRDIFTEAYFNRPG